MLREDAMYCLRMAYEHAFGVKSGLYYFWCFYSRNIKRLALTLLSVGVWFVPHSYGFRYLLSLYLTACIFLSVYHSRSKKSDNLRLLHPSGVTGFTHKSKFPSWVKNAILALVSINLTGYFWLNYLGIVSHAPYPYLLIDQALVPMLLATLLCGFLYTIKTIQKIYDYYFLQKAWKMHDFQVDYVSFASDWRLYKSLVHFLRGFVEWAWVATQTATFIVLVSGFIDSSLLVNNLFWVGVFLSASIIGLKAAYASGKLSSDYFLLKMMNRLDLQYDHDFSLLTPRPVASRMESSVKPGVDALKVERPKVNRFYQWVLDYAAPCAPCSSAFCIYDSDDEDEFIQSPSINT